jgi:hypothetical protein
MYRYRRVRDDFYVRTEIDMCVTFYGNLYLAEGGLGDSLFLTCVTGSCKGDETGIGDGIPGEMILSKYILHISPKSHRATIV